MASMSMQHLTIAILAGAAIAAAQPLPQLRTDAVPAGSVFHVKNTAQQPLTAYLIELVEYPGSSFTLFQDDAGTPIAPGAEKTIPVTNMTVGAAPEYVKITAALYADGSTAGDAAKAALITGRRKATLETTRELIARLEKGQAAGTGKDAVVADLKQWSDSLPQGRPNRLTAANINAAASRMAISGAIAKIEKGSVADALADLRASEKRMAAVKP